MITISVIIPIYNNEDYLVECLESVCGQSLKDFEIICINDGSTDGTLKILEEYAATYSNLKIINQSKSGAGIARNVGINAAEGEFVAFMDGDDYYPSNDVLECLYEGAKKVSLPVCGGSINQYRKGCIIKDFSGIDKKNKFSQGGKLYFEEYGYPFGFTRFIYKKDLLVKNGIQFPAFEVYEDPLFLAKVMMCQNEFYCITKVVYIHRVSIHQRNYTDERIVEMLKVLIEILKSAKQKKWRNLQEYTYNRTIEKIYIYVAQYSLSKPDIFVPLLNELVEVIDFNVLDKEKIVRQLSVEAMQDCIKQNKENICRLRELVKRFPSVIIYGAGEAGITVKKYLETSLNVEIRNFVVSSLEGNDKIIDGIPVMELDSVINLNDSTLFIIAVPHRYKAEIENTLKNREIENVFFIDYTAIKLFNELNVAF